MPSTVQLVPIPSITEQQLHREKGRTRIGRLTFAFTAHPEGRRG
uniref:Uncharacterized protein n=1 Tax=Setaria italica TaxID=4555 RepID=K3ZPP6_SETIT